MLRPEEAATGTPGRQQARAGTREGSKLAWESPLAWKRPRHRGSWRGHGGTRPKPSMPLHKSRKRRLVMLFRQGAFAGRTSAEGFFVKCDRTTMTQNDIDNGVLNIDIGFAPLKPAEFVILRIGRWVA